MKKKNFKELLTSIDQARKIHNNDNFRICKHCNKEFKTHKNNKSQEYCTELCWQKSHGLK